MTGGRDPGQVWMVVEYDCRDGHRHAVTVHQRAVPGWTIFDYVDNARSVVPNVVAVSFG